jgi:hypothetical protein
MKIEKAAIRYQDRICTGWRHASIGIEMLKAGICPMPYPGGDAQGFVTDVGEFVDRKIALDIAKNAGQIKNSIHHTMLFSEDLWDKNGVSL